MSNALPDSLPYLTADVPGVPAAIKRRYEDFEVDEISAYDACGSGDHTYFTIEKTGLATMRAVNDIARALGVPSHHIGVAGLKDARAVARQLLSVEHIPPERVQALEIPRIKVRSVSRHGNKLRIGHLRGNRFNIKLRECDPARIGDVRAVMERISTRGVPNYFGPQRFGLRGDTWQVGQALLRSDFPTAAALIAGRAGPHDTGPVLLARRLYDEGRYEESAAAWPYGFRECQRVARAMAHTRGNTKRAVLSLDRKMLQFYVSAYQSWLFNCVVAERIGAVDQVMLGDLAWKHATGAVFRVEDLAAEAPRAARFEISATGPLFGPRMTQPTGSPAEIEDRALSASGITADEFNRSPAVKYSGGRRPIRFRPEQTSADIGTDEDGPYIRLRFALDSGCYATSVLREICKQHMSEGLEEVD